MNKYFMENALTCYTASKFTIWKASIFGDIRWFNEGNITIKVSYYKGKMYLLEFIEHE